jgi:hypothetical protein
VLPPPLTSPLRSFAGWAAPHELNPVAAALLAQACALLSGSPEGLPRLITALEARRGEGAGLTRLSCLCLVRLMTRALDVAAVTSDFGGAKALMVMAQTFYTYLNPADGEVEELLCHPLVAASNTLRAISAEGGAAEAAGGLATPLKGPVEAGGGASGGIYTTPGSAASEGSSGDAGVGSAPRSDRRRRVYVQAFVRSHHIWQLMPFWEAAVFDTLGAEMSKIQRAAAGGVEGSPGGNPSSGTLRSGSGSKAEATAAAAADHREHDITAGQLGFFAFNMLAFGVRGERCVPHGAGTPALSLPGWRRQGVPCCVWQTRCFLTTASHCLHYHRFVSSLLFALSLPTLSAPCSVRRLLDKYARFIRLDAGETARLMASVGRFEAEHDRQVAQEERDRAARIAARPLPHDSAGGGSTGAAAVRSPPPPPLSGRLAGGAATVGLPLPHSGAAPAVATKGGSPAPPAPAGSGVGV